MAEDREERDPILVDDEALESGKSEPREGVLGGDDIPDDNDESWYEEEDGESQPEYGSLKKSVPVLKIVSLVLVLLLAAVVIFFHGRDDSVSPDPNAQSAAPQSALPAPAQAEPLTAALNVPLNEPAAPRPEPTIPSSPDPVLNFSPQEEPPAEASPTALNLTPVDTSDPAEAPEDPSRSFYPLNPTAPPETYQSAGPPAVAPPRVIPLLANASEPEALGPGSLSGTLAPEMMAFDERGGSRMTPAGEISSDLVPAEPVALSGGDTLTAPAEATPRVIPPQGEGPIVAEPPNDLPPPPTAPPVAGGEPLGAATPASPEPATQATSPAPPTTPPAATPPVATPPVATPPAATTPAVTTPAVTPPAATPPAATPPAATPPAATPPAATPPAATPPAATPPAATPPTATPPVATSPASNATPETLPPPAAAPGALSLPDEESGSNAASPAATPVADRFFLVNMGYGATLEAATALRDKLAAFSPPGELTVHEAKGSSGDSIFRVQMGYYASFDQANKDGRALAERAGTPRDFWAENISESEIKARGGKVLPLPPVATPGAE